MGDWCQGLQLGTAHAHVPHTWMRAREPQHPFYVSLTAAHQDNCDVVPFDFRDYLHKQAAVLADVTNESWCGNNYKPGLGHPLGWSDSDQLRQIAANRTQNVPP